MKINGLALSKSTYQQLKPAVSQLKQKKIVPHVAAVMIGTDQSSLSYIKAKRKAAKRLGIKFTFHHLERTPLYQKVAEFLRDVVNDKKVHGVIIQCPLPPSLSPQALIKRIPLNKDVDGFLPKSPHLPPIGLAVFKILKEIYYRHLSELIVPEEDVTPELITWMKQKNIVIIGRGETGGKPVGETLTKNRIKFIHLNRRTENKGEYLTQADVIITAVGKARIVKPKHIKPGAVLIGIGMHKKDNRFYGDYDENEIKNIAGFYTPTPGGIGPVNVACLLQNTVTAAKLLTQELAVGDI